ncbi:hypothetical protein FQR65_LT08654 [Abscondita terminalis]|nr:hypothetical protein FQR65_LT08654 [Abscondita terminalis]
MKTFHIVLLIGLIAVTNANTEVKALSVRDAQLSGIFDTLKCVVNLLGQVCTAKLVLISQALDLLEIKLECELTSLNILTCTSQALTSLITLITVFIQLSPDLMDLLICLGIIVQVP